MSQMMPQTCLSVSYLISSKRLLSGNIAYDGSCDANKTMSFICKKNLRSVAMLECRRNFSVLPLISVDCPFTQNRCGQPLNMLSLIDVFY